MNGANREVHKIMIIVFGYLDILFFSEHFKFKYNYKFTIKVYVFCRVRSHNFCALSLDWCCAASLLQQPDLGTNK